MKVRACAKYEAARPEFAVVLGEGSVMHHSAVLLLHLLPSECKQKAYINSIDRRELVNYV